MESLHNQLKRDLEIRGLSPKTQKHYLRNIQAFEQHFNKSADQLGLEDVLNYQYFLLTVKKLSPATLKHITCSLRFCYRNTLRKDFYFDIPTCKQPKKLPEVLSKEEVFQLMRAAKTPRDFTILSTFYSTGMRLEEVVYLKREDIDFDRMVITIRRGKGLKDRVVMLSPRLRALFIAYLDRGRPKSPSPYLFIGPRNTHLHKRSVQRIVMDAAKNAGLTKSVGPHTLRHSFATHLYEEGVDLRKIQMLLGHANLSTTMIYVHLASSFVKTIQSPFDSLPAFTRKKQQGGKA